jgi:hypothetical protein
MKLLSPRVHGYIDYTLVVLLFAAPALLRFPMSAAAVCYLTATVHLLVSLLTDYPLGGSRQIPFAVHGAIEFSLGVGLVASPWLFGFSHPGPVRSFFVAAGVVVLLVVAMTRYAATVIARAEPFDRYGR